MIKNIIFDMGNVLIRWSPKDLVARLGLEADEAELLEREVFCGFEWVSMDHGIMSQQDGLGLIAERRLEGERLELICAPCIIVVC